MRLSHARRADQDRTAKRLNELAIKEPKYLLFGGPLRERKVVVRQARYRIVDSVGAVGIGSHILFEDIAIARAQKAIQELSKLNYVVV